MTLRDVTGNDIGFIVALLAVLVAWLIQLRRQGAGWRTIAIWAVFGLYLVMLAGAVFLPRALVTGVPDPPRITQPLLKAWYWGSTLTVPWSDGTADLTRVQNMVMAVPLGFLLPLVVPWTLRRIVIVCIAVSAAIETVQLLISVIVGYIYRSFDVNDILDNSLGAVAGLGGHVVVAMLYRWHTGRDIRSMVHQTSDTR